MPGMLRLKDEEALKALLARGNLREARGIVAGIPFNSPQERQVVERAEGKGPNLAPIPKPPKVLVPKPPKPVSDIEELLDQQIRAVGNLPKPIREYCHLRGSKHRLDFAWPEYRYQGRQIGVEVQGMVHRSSKEQFNRDLEKRALGLLQGWMILEVGGEQIRSGKAMEWLQELFKGATKS